MILKLTNGKYHYLNNYNYRNVDYILSLKDSHPFSEDQIKIHCKNFINCVIENEGHFHIVKNEIDETVGWISLKFRNSWITANALYTILNIQHNDFNKINRTIREAIILHYFFTDDFKIKKKT